MDPSYAAADAAFAYQQQRQHDYITPAAMGSYDMNNFNQSSTAFAMFPNSNAHSSPAGFNDEPDLQVPSSNLSTASVPSASSSQVGSPEPYHHQLAAVGGSMEWATPVVAPATGLGVSPGIVGQGDYFAVSGTEYNSYPNPQDMNVFSDYAGAAVKDPNYVGELARISRSSTTVTSPSTLESCGATPALASSISSVVSSCNNTIKADPASPAAVVSPVSPVSSRKGSVTFVSPSSVAAAVSFSSSPPPLSATSWSTPSPTATRVSPFFSQSSGHFIAPLGSSCWFLLLPPYERFSR